MTLEYLSDLGKSMDKLLHVTSCNLRRGLFFCRSEFHCCLFQSLELLAASLSGAVWSSGEI